MGNISKFNDPPKIYTQKNRFIQSYGQCDACSPVVFLNKDKPHAISPDTEFVKNKNLVVQKIDEGYTAFLTPAINSFSVLNKSAFDCFEYFLIPENSTKINQELSDIWGKKTVDRIFKKMVDLGILVDVDASFIPHENPDTLTAWLHITDRCNLRCQSCYLTHKNIDMSLKIGIAAIDAIFRSALIHNYSHIKIKYAGGEPLFKFELIKRLHFHAVELSKKHCIELEEVILTNGTLLDVEKIHSIKEWGVKLTISLDETGKKTNQQRIFANGEGSANKVKMLVDISLYHGLAPKISITLTSNNINEFPDLTRWVLKRKLSFNINFDRRIGDLFNKESIKYDEAEMINGIFAGYKIIEQYLPQNSLLACLADRINLSAPRLRTCSLGLSYLVINPLGNVYKCQMIMNSPVTTIYSNDPLAHVIKNDNQIQNKIVDEKNLCSACKWKYWCTGGCPLNAQISNKGKELQPAYCNLYKSIIPEIIRLEALRILKYERN